MKKTVAFISTAALMAGTACGVWAETNDKSVSSFDRVERSVYDSNVNHTGKGEIYAQNSMEQSSETAAGDTNVISESNDEAGSESTRPSDSTHENMGSQTPRSTGASSDSGRTMRSGGSPSADKGGRAMTAGSSAE